LRLSKETPVKVMPEISLTVIFGGICVSSRFGVGTGGRSILCVGDFTGLTTEARGGGVGEQLANIKATTAFPK